MLHRVAFLPTSMHALTTTFVKLSGETVAGFENRTCLVVPHGIIHRKITNCLGWSFLISSVLTDPIIIMLR